MLIDKNGELWDEVFRAGTHTDSAGNVHTFTEQDIADIAARYNPTNHEAPLVIGHPKSDAPAYGWIESAKAVGGKLMVKYKDVADEFKDWARQGLYKKKSIKLYPDGGIRHVGYLGAQPPAIKGLPNFAFADDGEGKEFEYAESGLINVLQRMFRGFREWVISSESVEAADRVIPEYEIEDLRYFSDGNKSQPSYSEKGGDMNLKELQDKLEAVLAKNEQLEQQFSEAEAKRQAAETENTDLKNQLTAGERAARTEKHKAFCEAVVGAGRMLPAQLSRACAFMDALADAGELEFAEGDDTKKENAVEMFKAFVESYPEQIEFSEVATKDKAGKTPEAIDADGAVVIGKAAREYRESKRKEGIEISIEDAIAHVKTK